MPASTDTDEPFAAIRRRLLARARLFDDPRASAAGVRDTVEALTGADAASDEGPAAPARRAHPSPATEALS